MTLKQTVEEILKKETTETHARIFASEQFGVLAAHIRNKLIKELAAKRINNDKLPKGRLIKSKYYEKISDRQV